MFWRGIADDEAYLAVIRAYNEWLAEEYCAYSPNRLIAMGVLPDTGVDDAVAEMEYCAKAGLKGVNLHRFPAGQSYVTPDDDRFWEAAVDLEMPVASHTFGGTHPAREQGAHLHLPRRRSGPKSERDPVTLLFRFAGEQPIAPLQMAMAGVFDRLPELRVYWAESQCGWLPYSFDQIDDNYERNRYWGERDYGIKATARRPSEYLRDNCLWGFMRDPWGVKCRGEIGVNILLWGSDFAHATGNWPHSQDVIDETFVDVAEEERYAMLAGNAIEFFRLDAAVDLERELGAHDGGYGDRRIESWRTSTNWCEFFAGSLRRSNSRYPVIPAQAGIQAGWSLGNVRALAPLYPWIAACAGMTEKVGMTEDLRGHGAGQPHGLLPDSTSASTTPTWRRSTGAGTTSTATTPKPPSRAAGCSA